MEKLESLLLRLGLSLFTRVHGAPGRGQELADILWVVRLLVRLEDGGAGEGFAAECAAEGPLPRVHAAVVLHVVPELKRLAAVLALEGPVARVRRQVADEGAHVGKRLAAELAQHGVGRPGAAVELQDGAVVVVRHAGEVVLDEVEGLQRRGQQAQPGGRLHGQLLAELEGLQAVREDVASQLALVGERRPAVRAEERAGRRRRAAVSGALPTPTPSTPQALALLKPKTKRTSTSFFFF